MKGGLCVAKMVMVPAGFAIDTTEVTRGQYQSWLATSPAPDATCTPKTSPSYAPDAKCVASLNDVTDDPEHLPQACVDWCDAAAYCKGVGKRLCGKIGGGPTPFGKFADATSSQWFNACSSGGVNTYPYGNTHSPTACNGYDNPNPGFDFTPVGSLPLCQSTVDGYKGVFDLSGNVHEWEDSCQGVGAEAFCKVRGGSVVSALECAADGAGFMTNPGQSNFGIRCCKD
jgi:formylglycine-generating enzyme required for sulfatase activity